MREKKGSFFFSPVVPSLIHFPPLICHMFSISGKLKSPRNMWVTQVWAGGLRHCGDALRLCVHLSLFPLSLGFSSFETNISPCKEGLTVWVNSCVLDINLDQAACRKGGKWGKIHNRQHLASFEHCCKNIPHSVLVHSRTHRKDQNKLQHFQHYTEGLPLMHCIY